MHDIDLLTFQVGGDVDVKGHDDRASRGELRHERLGVVFQVRSSVGAVLQERGVPLVVDVLGQV